MIAKKVMPPDTSEVMGKPVRALGIDFGEKRIGLALSDAEGRWAMPFATLERRTDRRAAHRIADLARREGVEMLVFGEPLGPGGEIGEAARRVHRFGARLARITRLPIRWIDETLTTVEAAERLRAAGLDRPGKRERRDMVAAQILLQEALDRERASRSSPSGGTLHSSPSGGTLRSSPSGGTLRSSPSGGTL